MEKYIIEGAISHALIGEMIGTDTSAGETGGISAFAGRVRTDKAGEKSVIAIEYSCYESMLEEAVASITDIVRKAFSDVRTVNIIHSTGIVNAGEISLLVVVTAGHRDQAMRACTHTVELVKERLPVWKKEILSDEGHRWV
jgi:molybdopterin synthase catalytic subunit